MKDILKKINLLLASSGKKGLSFVELQQKCTKIPKKTLLTLLLELQQEGRVLFFKKRFVLSATLGLVLAEVVRVNKTFGFAKPVAPTKTNPDQKEYFIPGKFMKGALPKDIVLIRPFLEHTTTHEGEILSVVSVGTARLTGQIALTVNGYVVQPDGMIRYPMTVEKGSEGGAAAGDKVLAQVVTRGQRHSEHRVAVVRVYGSGEVAKVCVDAMLDHAGVSAIFPPPVAQQAQKLALSGITEQDLVERSDFRTQKAFTIDGADAKDLDDAVYLEKQENGYVLYVHIADVSHYVSYQSALDKEAFARGTSIYIADRVIPMLPKALSNGICSLTAGEDRLTLTAIMSLDEKGRLLDYRFEKGVIRSCVQGVYGEVNTLLDGSATNTIQKKYQMVLSQIQLMKQLADILSANKKNRGAPEIISKESKIYTDESGVAVGVVPRKVGVAERLIEEFMLTANEATAKFGKSKNLPFLYRIHEKPALEKLQTLNRLLQAMGLQTKPLLPDVSSKILASILEKVRGSDVQSAVHLQILRTMSKAKYSSNPLGHFGLSLRDYAHFTSPIRRYPDLLVHRTIGEFLGNGSEETLQKRYQNYANKAGLQSTQTEIQAMRLERSCEDCYKAEFMQPFIGKQFEGVISSVAPHGIYVALDNTIEGLVRGENLPGGPFDYDGLISYTNPITGQQYRVGQSVMVQCVGATVSTGRIDFQLVQQEQNPKTLQTSAPKKAKPKKPKPPKLIVKKTSLDGERTPIKPREKTKDRGQTSKSSKRKSITAPNALKRSTKGKNSPRKSNQSLPK